MSDETLLREHWRAGARRELVTGIVRLYGREILSYLMATLRGEGEAAEAFSQFCFNLWQGSEAYRGEASFRTWSYALARHAVGRVVRERGRRRRHVNLTSVPEVDELAAKVRSETLEHLRTETRDRIRMLRDELDPDEQTLLILRVDRGFTWPEVARIMNDGEPIDDRAVASLRKRFERIKERLRRRALELR